MRRPRPNTLSLVLPCYNERDSVRSLLGGLIANWESLRQAAQVDALEVVVVDDGSDDGSDAELAAFAGRAQVLRHPWRMGYGAALKTGIAAASGSYIAIFDLDATYEPFDLAPMLARLRAEDLDVVIGDRLHDIRNMPLSRRLGNFFFRAIIRLCFGRRIGDSCSGQRVFRATHARFFCDHLPDRLNYSLAMTLKSLRAGLPLAEVPIRYYRRIGRSKLNIGCDGLVFLSTILAYRLPPGVGIRVSRPARPAIAMETRAK